MADPLYPPIGSVGTGLLAVPQQKYPPIGRIGDGYVPGTPLSPEKPYEAYIDPTVTPEQVQAYNLRVRMMGEMKGGGKPGDIVGNLKYMAQQIAPALLGGGAAATLAKVAGPLGVAGRTLLSGTTAGVTDLALTGDPKSAIKTGLATSLFQGGGEGLAGLRNARNLRVQQEPFKTELQRQQIANAQHLKDKVQFQDVDLPQYRQDLAAHQSAQAAQDLNVAKNAAFYESMNTAVGGATANAHAKNLADKVKAQVAPWADIESTPAGISRMIGPDWKKVGDAYDVFLKETMATARGQQIQIPAAAADKLGIPTKTRVETSKTRTNPSDDVVFVDGADALEKTVGKSRKFPKEYNQVAKALDAADIGDPKIRKMYLEALSFKTFAEANRIVENGVYHPERVQKGLAGAQPRRAADIRQTELDAPLRESVPFEPVSPPAVPSPLTPPAKPVEPKAPVFESPVDVTYAQSGATLPAKLLGHLGLSAAGVGGLHAHSMATQLANKLPTKPVYSAPPHTPLGKETGLGDYVRGQEVLPRLAGTGIAQGANVASRMMEWDYILENILEATKRPEPPSPLRPAKPSKATEEEE